MKDLIILALIIFLIYHTGMIIEIKRESIKLSHENDSLVNVCDSLNRYFTLLNKAKHEIPAGLINDLTGVDTLYYEQINYYHEGRIANH